MSREQKKFLFEVRTINKDPSKKKDEPEKRQEGEGAEKLTPGAKKAQERKRHTIRSTRQKGRSRAINKKKTREKLKPPT